jgi:hypothetical protein
VTLFETDLQMAKRHVHHGERLVAKQRKIVHYLDDHGLPTELASGLLITFESALEMHREHLARLANKPA